MNRIFLFLLFSFPVFLFAQSDVIELGILPTEYGEGMPPEEFLELEEKIVDQIELIPRYKIVKRQEDFYDVKMTDSWEAQIETIRKQGVDSNVPYLLQIVFGDTDWASKLEEVEISKAVIKDSVVVKPRKVAKYWTQSATIWVTLNLYKVETGEMESSKTFQSSSLSDMNYSRTKPHARQDRAKAVAAAKNRLLPNIKRTLKTLVPLNVRLLKTIEESKKEIKKVSINAGSFHDLINEEKLYIYYEQEHIVDGKPVIREIDAGSLEIIELREKTAVCEVKKGGQKLKKLIAEGKDLKCNFKNFVRWADGYGF